MPFPKNSSLEMPILQELVAIGGAEDIRFLYSRLAKYFPQITDREITLIGNNTLDSWRKLVQRAGRELDEKGFVKRERGRWAITEKGRTEVAAESQGFVVTQKESRKLAHGEIQTMLVEIGESLGFCGETEFEFYDVVWRETEKSPRLSHVFEVQSKGNIDSAFAKLKRAYAAQRTKIFLVLASEKDLRRARQSLVREFHDLENVIFILTFSQIAEVHGNLQKVAEILREFLLK